MRHVTYMNKSCHTQTCMHAPYARCKSSMSHICMRHVTSPIWTSQVLYATRHVTHMNKSRHVPHMNKSGLGHPYVRIHTPSTGENHVTHMYESRHTYTQVLSHICVMCDKIHADTKVCVSHIGCLKLQVSFRQRTTNFKALLRKMSYRANDYRVLLRKIICVMCDKIHANIKVCVYLSHICTYKSYHTYGEVGGWGRVPISRI